MEAEPSTGTFPLWLHPADRRTGAQAFALHLLLVVAFYSMEALRLARRPLLLPADPGNISYSRRSDSARWASSTRTSFVRFAANNTTGMIRQHFDNINNNSSDSPGSKAERWTEQKMSLNFATSPRASGQQQTADGGMPLLYDFCQRPFQSVFTCYTCTAPTFTTNHLLLDRMIPGQQLRTTMSNCLAPAAAAAPALTAGEELAVSSRWWAKRRPIGSSFASSSTICHLCGNRNILNP